MKQVVVFWCPAAQIDQVKIECEIQDLQGTVIQEAKPLRCFEMRRYGCRHSESKACLLNVPKPIQGNFRLREATTQ